MHERILSNFIILDVIETQRPIHTYKIPSPWQFRGLKNVLKIDMATQATPIQFVNGRFGKQKLYRYIYIIAHETPDPRPIRMSPHHVFIDGLVCTQEIPLVEMIHDDILRHIWI